MKVLWFTNTPSLAEERLSNKPTGGGWIKSLESRLKKQKGIKLGIVFYYPKKIHFFEFNKTKYYPVYTNTGGKIKKLITRIKGSIEPKEDVQKFLQIISDFKPDIIHIHGTEGPFGLIQEKIKNIPIVISIQGNILVCKYKWYSGITKAHVKKYSNSIDKLLYRDYNSIYKSFNKRAEREKNILSSSKNIIGRTSWDKRITSILAKDSKYFHNDEILRDSFYKNKWSNIKSKPFIIFTTSSNSIYKGIEVMLQTVKLLDEFEFDYKWYVAGLKNSDKVIKIVNKSFNLRPSNNVIFLGTLNEKELVDNLLASHVYVMPSHIENSPNNLCEAMILGLPCIATDVGGTSSLLENKKEGILIQDGDPWSLAGAIIEMHNNYKTAIKYGVNARNKAIKRHNPLKIINDLINIYSKLIKNH